jgi:hypothetical protein
MEPRFGHDFGNVRVHTDAKAAKSAKAVNALAYTVGRDVVFGAGQYAPRSSTGQMLLAHELTHVRQQRRIGDRPQHLSFGPLDDGFERAADLRGRNIRANDLVLADSNRRILQRQTTPPQDESKKQKPSTAKEVIIQPSPQKIPAQQVKSNADLDAKQTTPAKTEADKEKKGIEKEFGVTLETETKKEEGKLTTEVAGKYKFGVTIPLTEKLQWGHLSLFKEAETEGAIGVHSSNDPRGSLTSLELQAAIQMISLNFEKVRAPLGLGTLGLGVSASPQVAFEYSPEENKGTSKFGVAAEAELKYKRREESPFFIKINAGVEKTFDKEGNANFKWGPMLWKTSATIGFEF